MKISNKKYQIDGAYHWQEDTYDKDDYFDNVEDAIEAAKKRIEDGSDSVLVISQRVAVVRDSSRPAPVVAVEMV